MSFLFPASAETILFEEDFESYAHGSNLIGQGGWIKEPNNSEYTGTTLVGDSTNMGSRVANGRLTEGCSGMGVATNLFSAALSEDTVYTLTFDGYAHSGTPGPPSHNCSVGFHSSDYSSIGWWTQNNPEDQIPDFVGWYFVPWGLVDVPAEYIEGGYGEVVTLTTIVDPVNLECYGIADFGEDGTFETPHYTFDIERFHHIDGITVVQDYRLGGTEFDNIKLTAEPKPDSVWVDDDYCDSCPNDGHTWGYDAFVMGTAPGRGGKPV